MIEKRCFLVEKKYETGTPFECNYQNDMFYRCCCDTLYFELQKECIYICIVSHPDTASLHLAASNYYLISLLLPLTTTTTFTYYSYLTLTTTSYSDPNIA